jgi:hypothetical protein
MRSTHHRYEILAYNTPFDKPTIYPDLNAALQSPSATLKMYGKSAPLAKVMM